MRFRKQSRTMAVGALTVALMLPVQALAAGGGGHGGGEPTDTTGSLYSDLVIALRTEDGTPILKRFDVPADEDSEATTEYCVQPVAYEAVPGVPATTNPLDGRDVWVIPLQGEWLPPYAGTVPVAEIEPCDPKPQYAMFVSETELERLNLARTSDEVIADKLAAVEEKLTTAGEISLDGAGRITVDGVSLDASPEFAAMYDSLMKTGTLPGLPSAMSGPPAEVGIFDAWELAAAAIGTAASKPVPITVDTVEYYNRVIEFPLDTEAGEYTSPWGVSFLRSENPDDPGVPMAAGERFVDYSAFTYNRSETFKGSVTWLDVSTLTWQVSRITDVVQFTQLPAEPIGTRTLSGVTAFAQLADDVRAVILYYHDHETIPGFYIDPVGVDTTAAQLKAITDPAVSLTVPADAFQAESFAMATTMFNPFGGIVRDGLKLQITFDAATALAEGDITAAATGGGDPLDLAVVDGNLVGLWGAALGDTLGKGQKVTTTFDVLAAETAAPGPYDVRLELVDVDPDPDAVLAEDSGIVEVRDNVPTVLWAGDIYPLVTQATPFQVPVTVYSPTAGEADLNVLLTGPGDDPSTDLIEALENGDATAYASDGTDMVAMPLTLDGDGRLAGSWHQSLDAGYTPVTWYLTVNESSLLGGYAIDVALVGGNSVETAWISVAAPEQHGEQPPGAGEDVTAPVVTILPVGTLDSEASFTLSANEPDVTYVVRLVENDIPGEWEPATEAGKSYTGLTPGIYSFQVKATDAVGNVSGMYAKTWVVEPESSSGQVAPTTTVIGGPADNCWLLAHNATFDLQSSDPSAAYIVTVNGKYWGTSNTGAVVVRGLKAGANTITIRAIAGGIADVTADVRVVHVPRGVKSLSHTNAWRLRNGEKHLFGVSAVTKRYGEVFRVRSQEIKRIALVVSEGARYGKVHVFLNGKRLTSSAIDLRSATSQAKVLIPIKTFDSLRHGLVTVKVVSTGKVVQLEGIGISSR